MADAHPPRVTSNHATAARGAPHGLAHITAQPAQQPAAVGGSAGPAGGGEGTVGGGLAPRGLGAAAGAMAGT